MTWETVRRTLVCATCGREGEFVYEQATGSYADGPMTFKGLSAGFNFKDTGFVSTSTITCTKCQKVVMGANRGGTPAPATP